MDNLIKNLRNLAAFAHGDVSFADEAADEIERLLAREARMREALDYYAKNHYPNVNDGPWGANSTDFGDVARAALGEEKKG